jgi:hypothetical protein
MVSLPFSLGVGRMSLELYMRLQSVSYDFALFLLSNCALGALLF